METKKKKETHRNRNIFCKKEKPLKIQCFAVSTSIASFQVVWNLNFKYFSISCSVNQWLFFFCSKTVSLCNSPLLMLCCYFSFFHLTLTVWLDFHFYANDVINKTLAMSSIFLFRLLLLSNRNCFVKTEK